jgi:hypothetical protein
MAEEAGEAGGGNCQDTANPYPQWGGRLGVTSVPPC